VRLRLDRKGVCSALAAVLLVFGGFASGFVACLHLKIAASSDTRQQYLQQAGDALPPVRAGVLTALRAFQDGYIKRDPKDLDSFMSRLFRQSDDVLILGTDAGEWVRGYPAAARFIRTDWLAWGDFRFAVDDSVIWSSGDVAWVASIGAVHSKGGDRPLRFTAVLTRDGDHWLFREVNFQWDDSDPGPAALLHPHTYMRLVRLAFRRMTLGRSYSTAR
jgi:ketosteroid isomerase-like protein